MTGPEWSLLVASVLVAVPAVRAAGRVLLARWKDAAATRAERKLDKRTGQPRQTEAARIERLKNEANDLLEFGALAPSWALWCALAGIALTLGARAYPLFCP